MFSDWIIFIILFLTIIALNAFKLYLTYQLMKYFPEQYKQAGSPSLFLVNLNFWKFERYAINKEYKSIKDARIRNIFNVYLTLLMLFVAEFTYLVIRYL